MIDQMTNGRFEVLNDEVSGPYVFVAVDQLKQVEPLLKARHIYYWVDGGSQSINGKPFVTVINFGRNGDKSEIQNLLDAA